MLFFLHVYITYIDRSERLFLYYFTSSSPAVYLIASNTISPGSGVWGSLILFYFLLKEVKDNKFPLKLELSDSQMLNYFKKETYFMEVLYRIR